MTRRFVAPVMMVAVAAVAAAQQWPASWTMAQRPLHVFGNVYYVGARGVSAILITS